MSFLNRSRYDQRLRTIILGSVVGVLGLGVGLFGYRAFATESPSANTTTPATAAAAPANTNDLWTQIQQFHNRMDKLFASEFGQADTHNHSAFAVPNMDLRDAKDHYEVTMDMPGAQQNSIKVDVHGRLLSVSGQRNESSQSDKGQVLRQERSTAQWARALTLPGPVNAGAVQSKYANGVLTISIPKATEKEQVASTAPAPAPSKENATSALSAGGPWIGASPQLWATPFSSNDPWDQLDQFHRNMDQLFADTFDQSNPNATLTGVQEFTVPSMDISDQKDHYEVTMDMPGVDKGKIKVNVDGQQLSVTGQREINSESNNTGKVLRSERGTAEFERSVTLPGPVQVSAVKASYNNGTLTIDLPKAEAGAMPTSVPVE